MVSGRAGVLQRRALLILCPYTPTLEDWGSVYFWGLDSRVSGLCWGSSASGDSWWRAGGAAAPAIVVKITSFFLATRISSLKFLAKIFFL